MSVFTSHLARNTLALIAAGSVILIATAILALWLVGRTSASADQVARDRAVRTSASTILSLLLDAETGQRGFLLTSDESYLQPFKDARSRLDTEFDILRQAAAKSSITETNISRLQELTAAKLSELNRTIELYSSGRREDALTVVKSNEGRSVMDQARAVLRETVQSAEIRVSESLANMQSEARQLAWVTGLGGLCIILFSGYAFYIVKANTEGIVQARNEVIDLNTSLEDRVAERTTALSRANDEIQRFAYIVSHDLRAPLVNIMGFTSELEVSIAALRTYFGASKQTAEQELAARRAADEDAPEAVHFIRASTQKMDGLITAILKLSREGRRELKRERVKLEELFASAVTSLQHQIESAGAKVDLADELPSVVADRLALEQVFGNILENAVKYLHQDRPGVITVAARETGGRVKVSIADNGRGIEAKDLERVFELFRRAGVQDRPGEGVGLAHVRALVRRMGGEISVSSTYGEGTTFEVDLPKKLRIHEAGSETI